jgi:enterochelin esterase-like enzyme
LLILLLSLLIVACDPLAPVFTPTPQIIIVTPEASQTPIATPTLPPTDTPEPSPTPPATATATPLPCEGDNGQIITFDDFRSPVAGENLRYRVYIPPCYVEAERRYPYVILLHGLRENEVQWDELGVNEALDQGIRLGALPPMILVMPYFGSIGTRNEFPPDPSYETVILDELTPAVERDFCTWEHRSARAIGGISRGGFWAYSIAMRHPDIFGAVGGHSATFDETNAPPAFNPLELALNTPFLSEADLRMFIDNGASDPAGEELQLFSSRLSSRGIAHTYVIHPVGGHDDEYWQAHLPEYLEFYGQEWTNDRAELPSCLEPSP